MAEHERRRAVEVRLLELRDVLEEQGHTDAEIASRLAEARKVAAADAATAAGR
uniref:CWF21 domain-containing protein n=2 Tax=Oryza brachyantha TaxID=4533 RepID=J3MRB0_ORYBR